MVNYDVLYALLGDLTPLKADCGTVCRAACCQGSDKDGMLLFPGEAAWLPEDTPLVEQNGRQLFVCDGHCDRTKRPLSCRLFPLFPILTESGRIRAVYDPRAFRLCSLVQLQNHVRLDRAFVRAVRAIGRRVAASPEGRAFLQEQTEEIREWNRFLTLGEFRSPIARRKRGRSK